MLDPISPAAAPGLLIVDDDPLVLRSLARQMQEFDVHLASTARGALDILRRENLDVVLTDLKMPEMDGLSLIEAIHRVDMDLPVVLLTGEPSMESAISAVGLGAFSYFTKPADFGELRASLNRAVSTYQFVALRRDASDSVGGEDIRETEELFRSGLQQLWMAYQPLVSTDSWATVGYEALLRTREPSIPHPGVFLQLARRLGMLHQLGQAARQRAAAEAILSGAQNRMLFVNIGAVDLADPDLFLSESPLGQIAHRVVLELTEREGLEGVADLPARISSLRSLGFRIAIDDLGAGYSALNYFATIEPEVIKLDMSLVRSIHTHVVKQRTVLSLVQLAHQLGIEVVAEGVETAEECRVLCDLGCDYLQGFLFSRPEAAFPNVSWSPALAGQG